MLAIGRALMARPRLLLLDEPSLGLAPLLVRQIFAAIRELNEREKLTVFLVEQNAYHALKLAHRGYVMVNGEITLKGGGASCCNGRKSAPPISKAGSAEMDRLYAGETIGHVILVDPLCSAAAARWLSGRAIAATWRPPWQVAIAMLLIAAAARFIHFALFQGDLLSSAVLRGRRCIFLILGLLAWRMPRAAQMVRQYPWLYARTSPLSWRKLG